MKALLCGATPNSVRFCGLGAFGAGSQGLQDAGFKAQGFGELGGQNQYKFVLGQRILGSKIRLLGALWPESI